MRMLPTKSFPAHIRDTIIWRAHEKIAAVKRYLIKVLLTAADA
jgi:hypothetical protein